MKNQQRANEQLKGDLAVSKSNHEQDVEQLQGDLALLRDDLKMTREELVEAQQRIADSKSTISGLNEDLERFRKLQEESAMEVRFSTGGVGGGGGDVIENLDKIWIVRILEKLKCVGRTFVHRQLCVNYAVLCVHECMHVYMCDEVSVSLCLCKHSGLLRDGMP